MHDTKEKQGIVFAEQFQSLLDGTRCVYGYFIKE